MVNETKYPPALVPLLAIAAAVLVGLLLTVPTAKGAEVPPADVRLRAKAALSLAQAQSHAIAARARGPAVAPMPHPVVPKAVTYAEGYRAATARETPLVVLVGCDAPRPAGAIVAKAEHFADVKPPAVVVAIPVGQRLVIDAALPATEATPEAVQKAVDSAQRKMDHREEMPKRVAPVPLDWQINADAPACICGDKCECAANTCPGKCAVASRPVLRTTTGRLVRQQADGSYRFVDAPPVAYAAVWPAAPAVVSSCPGGNCPLPVMQFRGLVK